MRRGPSWSEPCSKRKIMIADDAPRRHGEGRRHNLLAFPSQKEAGGMVTTAGIALLGCGTVGASVAERLLHERDAIERSSGVRYELRAIAVRDVTKPRPSTTDPNLFTTDTRALVDDPH